MHSASNDTKPYYYYLINFVEECLQKGKERREA